MTKALGTLLTLGGLQVAMLIFWIISTIWFIASQYQTGLDKRLCKCEQLNSQDRSIEPRIVNGTEFTSKHGLSWLASIYYQIDKNDKSTVGKLKKMGCSSVDKYPINNYPMIAIQRFASSLTLLPLP